MSEPPTHTDAAERGRVLLVLSSRWFRLGVLAALVVVAVALTVRGDVVGIDGLRAAVDRAGWAGPVVLAGLYAIAATLLVPASPFTIAAGVLFGPVLGTLTALVGATLGATGAFLLGRSLGRDAVAAFGGRPLERIDRALAQRGFVALLIVRLVPLFPFNLVNVAAGVTGLRLRVFVLATAVGIVPGTVAFAALGGTIDDPTSPAFIAALALFVVVTVGAGLMARRLRARDRAAVVDAAVEAAVDAAVDVAG